MLDLLEQMEVFSKNRQAGGENIKNNMRAMGFADATHDAERVQACIRAITHDLNGENGDICYSTHKASAALKFWQTLFPEQYDAHILKIAESRVSAAVKWDGNSRVSSSITFEDDNGQDREWTEVSSDQGILDAQFRALMGGLKKKNVVISDQIKSVEIVDYHQDSIGTGSNARVITSMTDRKSVV